MTKGQIRVGCSATKRRMTDRFTAVNDNPSERYLKRAQVIKQMSLNPRLFNYIDQRTWFARFLYMGYKNSVVQILSCLFK